MDNITRTDISDCDKEPIHIPGHIQSHGFLLALNPRTLAIERVSDNIGSFTGISPTDILGREISVLHDAIQTKKRFLTY